MINTTICWVSVAVLLCTATVAHADNSRNAQRLGAELLILQGDVRLLDDPKISDLHKNGLRARLNGGLSILTLLLRENGDLQTSVVLRLRDALKQGNTAVFLDTLTDLITRHPLDLFAISSAKLTTNRLQRAKSIHEEACAGCHDMPDLETPLPAHNLFKQAQGMAQAEFTARLLNGVRGDQLTSLANPLTTEDIASLVAYYRSQNGDALNQ